MIADSENGGNFKINKTKSKKFIIIIIKKYIFFNSYMSTKWFFQHPPKKKTEGIHNFQLIQNLSQFWFVVFVKPEINKYYLFYN